jgi:glycosyltransferase involved in cell wall biosynthesis
LRLLLVVDVFPPTRTSAAVQMHDLAVTLTRLGHKCTVLTPDDSIAEPFKLEHGDLFPILRIRSAPLKRINLVSRAINEMMLSTRMWNVYRASPIASDSCDGVIFYSPSIFFGRFVARLKSLHRCPAYLVLRDVFPDWAADLGIMRKGPHFWLFKAYARYQYSIADRIGVESPSNRMYFAPADQRVEVLNNWIDIDSHPAPPYALPDELRGLKLLVYAGNIGVAQDMDNLLRLSQGLADRDQVRILFVGSGRERPRFEAEVSRLQLRKVVFFPEIDPHHLRGLLRCCHIGLISLDRRLRSHNIPGKLLSYLEAGLAVLGSVNPGNVIKSIVEGAGAGLVIWNGEDKAFVEAACRLLDDDDARSRMATAAQQLCHAKFSSSAAASQILGFFDESSKNQHSTTVAS